jgi:hypothetical protein
MTRTEAIAEPKLPRALLSRNCQRKGYARFAVPVKNRSSRWGDRDPRKMNKMASKVNTLAKPVSSDIKYDRISQTDRRQQAI